MGVVAAPRCDLAAELSAAFLFSRAARPHSSPHRMRQVIRDLPGSKIREVANAAHRPQRRAARSGSARATRRRRQFIREAAVALARRRRDLLLAQPRPAPSCARRSPRYVSALHPAARCRRASPSRPSGVNALMLAMQALVGAGDEVVAVTPVWPNLTAQPAILGARVVRLPAAGASGGAWRLDLDALRACRDRRRPACCSSIRRTTRPAGR